MTKKINSFNLHVVRCVKCGGKEYYHHKSPEETMQFSDIFLHSRIYCEKCIEEMTKELEEATSTRRELDMYGTD